MVCFFYTHTHKHSFIFLECPWYFPCLFFLDNEIPGQLTNCKTIPPDGVDRQEHLCYLFFNFSSRLLSFRVFFSFQFLTLFPTWLL